MEFLGRPPPLLWLEPEALNFLNNFGWLRSLWSCPKEKKEPPRGYIDPSSFQDTRAVTIVSRSMLWRAQFKLDLCLFYANIRAQALKEGLWERQQ